ncbi:class I SAM-dependent methyltransferase [Calothrix sp. UHCC 0171]|uniref:class I SAM-dependent methyltransferase n=1 Tax=Calothrix sp. UHCC 0171 TaxID=3110245 RepID=UPI002B202A68|nr:class I SAM-dependent methyltransferase [Calothrix sp. UHCC 0171]MEA5573377.1 class I SAM-dependent methyltransferase [Calothrix sp. UHCC 0171]
MKIAQVAKAAIENFSHHQIGTCNICGNVTFFVCIDAKTARNNMYCPFCYSSSRKRHVAKVILTQIEKQKNLQKISSIAQLATVNNWSFYNTDVDDAFFKYLYPSDSYVCSSFEPSIQPGTEIRKQVYCQSLEKLTFADASFDFVITEDVLEHVRHHEQAFQELHRVLKPEGYHIFTIPCNFDQATITRVDTSGDEDIHLLPPEYHGDRLRGQILAYRTFGIDIFELLDRIGFKTQVDFSSYIDRKSGIFDSYVFCSQKIG